MPSWNLWYEVVLAREDCCTDSVLVCGIESVYNPVDDSKITVEGVIPIAGNYETNSGRGLEPKFSRLKNVKPMGMKGALAMMVKYAPP